MIRSLRFLTASALLLLACDLRVAGWQVSLAPPAPTPTLAPSLPTATPTLFAQRPATTLPTQFATPLASPSAAARVPTVEWKGGTQTVETKNLTIHYPDFFDANETRKHADALQKAFDGYWELFAFGNENPFGGRKTTITYDLTVAPSYANGAYDVKMGRTALTLNRLTNPPIPVYYHELVHVFQHAQWMARRYYVDRFIDGMNEAFADYYAYYYGHETSKDPGTIRIFEGWRDKAGEALKQYEARSVDPYTLDWGEHPPPPSGENYFFAMLFRVSDRCGWGVWQKFYASRAGMVTAFPQEKQVDMRHPLIKKGFADFVAGLGQACGQDLKPMFRAWRFEM